MMKLLIAIAIFMILYINVSYATYTIKEDANAKTDKKEVEDMIEKKLMLELGKLLVINQAGSIDKDTADVLSGMNTGNLKNPIQDAMEKFPLVSELYEELLESQLNKKLSEDEKNEKMKEFLMKFAEYKVMEKTQKVLERMNVSEFEQDKNGLTQALKFGVSAIMMKKLINKANEIKKRKFNWKPNCITRFFENIANKWYHNRKVNMYFYSDENCKQAKVLTFDKYGNIFDSAEKETYSDIQCIDNHKVAIDFTWRKDNVLSGLDNIEVEYDQCVPLSQYDNIKKIGGEDVYVKVRWDKRENSKYGWCTGKSAEAASTIVPNTRKQ